MIEFRNNFKIIENVSELPNLLNRKELFLDIESQRVFDNDKVGGLYPWKGDRICGFSISADDLKEVWYVPIRHTGKYNEGKNLPIEPVMQWVKDVIQSAYEWINHNVKFDAMFFDVGDGVEFGNTRLVDTLTQCKLYYSDRITYGLKPVCADWLDYDTGSLDEVKQFLDAIKSKSYADVPVNTLGVYANDDVRMNRLLYRFLQDKLQTRIEQTSQSQAEAVKQLIETEIKMTTVLFDMEKEGMRIDEQQCKIESVKTLRTMIKNATEIAEISGREFTNSNACMFDILITQFGLPVLATIKEKKDGRWYDTGRPSFDKDAMALYKVHPSVTSNEKTNNLVQLIAEYRKEQQYKSLFLDTFLELHHEGRVHPNYNQSVKTGRLSCSKPNSQQQNQRSKKLMHPDFGCGFISNDYSQIEYRLIVHYAKIEAAIKAYNEDPTTDYHQWVADLLQIIRKPAKQLNFGMAYGQGKNGVTKKLMANEHIIEMMGERVNQMIEAGQLDPQLRLVKFKELCKAHAESSYDSYHNTLPEIRETSRRAIDTAAMRGFIFNLYGRRRYLPGRASYKAFNSLIQSCAADIMKERMVATSPRWNSESRSWGIHLRANVHDELLTGVPLEVLYDPKLHSFLCDTLENTDIKFKVPILTGLGISPNNWSEAAGDEIIQTEDEKFIAGKIR
jgi:DNA polymerase-1